MISFIEMPDLSINKRIIPQPYFEALKSDDKSEWKQAMDSEIESMKKYDVVDIIKRPAEKKPSGL